MTNTDTARWGPKQKHMNERKPKCLGSRSLTLTHSLSLTLYISTSYNPSNWPSSQRTAPGSKAEGDWREKGKRNNEAYGLANENRRGKMLFTKATSHHSTHCWQHACSVTTIASLTFLPRQKNRIIIILVTASLWPLHAPPPRPDPTTNNIHDSASVIIPQLQKKSQTTTSSYSSKGKIRIKAPSTISSSLTRISVIISHLVSHTTTTDGLFWSRHSKKTNAGRIKWLCSSNSPRE